MSAMREVILAMKLSHAQQRFFQRAVFLNELEKEHYAPSRILKTKVAIALMQKGVLEKIEPYTYVFTAYGKQLAQSLMPQRTVRITNNL
jgi:hypothetical protein